MDILKLFPELNTWNNGKPAPLQVWLATYGSVKAGLAYVHELFWPQFVEHDGCILLAGFNKEAYAGFLAEYKEDKRAIEATMNHKHIGDLFACDNNEYDDETLTYFGNLLKDMWQLKLNRDFPAKKIKVDLIIDNDEYQVTCYQV